MSNGSKIVNDKSLFNRRYGDDSDDDFSTDDFDLDHAEMVADVRREAKLANILSRAEQAQEAREDRRQRQRGGGKNLRKFRDGSRD